MKRFLLLCVALIASYYTANAQVDDVYVHSDSSIQKEHAAEQLPADTVARDNGLIYFTVPKKFNIKDKIIVKNNSPYTILKMVVAADVLDRGDYEVVGQAAYLAPGMEREICQWGDNGLKRLRGKNMLVKVKGAKVNPMIQGNKVDVYALGEVHVDTRKIDYEALKNLRPEDITYKFRVRYGEADHDLYLYVESPDNFDF